MIWLSGLGTVLEGEKGLCLLWTSVSQCLGPVNLKSARWSPDTVMGRPPEHGKVCTKTQREDQNQLWYGIILNNCRDECGIRWITSSNHLNYTHLCLYLQRGLHSQVLHSVLDAIVSCSVSWYRPAALRPFTAKKASKTLEYQDGFT